MEKYVNALEFIGNTDLYADPEKLDFMKGVKTVMMLDHNLSLEDKKRIDVMYDELHDTILGRYLNSLKNQ